MIQNIHFVYLYRVIKSIHKKKMSECTHLKYDDSFFGLFCTPLGWADPGGSAIPGQPVARTEQAPIPWPRFKNQFNIQATRWVAFQILSWKEQILHMILAKRPRSDTDHRFSQRHTAFRKTANLGYRHTPKRVLFHEIYKNPSTMTKKERHSTDG